MIGGGDALRAEVGDGRRLAARAGLDELQGGQAALGLPAFGAAAQRDADGEQDGDVASVHGFSPCRKTRQRKLCESLRRPQAPFPAPQIARTLAVPTTVSTPQPTPDKPREGK